MRPSSSPVQKELLLSWNGTLWSEYVEGFGVQSAPQNIGDSSMSPFPSGAFSSLLLPRTMGGGSPLPGLLHHASAYLYSPFPLSPPDPRRSEREII